MEVPSITRSQPAVSQLANGHELASANRLMDEWISGCDADHQKRPA